MSKPLKIEHYSTISGKVPYEEWIDSLKDRIFRARINKRIDNVENGHFGDTSPVGEGVQELRFFFGPGYRVYYGIDEDVIVLLLCGGDKSTQSKDIKKAKEYWNDYKESKNER